MSELFTPPRYFKDVAFHRHTDRTIGWLELFYDLVYVATLIQIGNFLSDNLTLLGFGQFLVMMFVVWWSWGGETLYQNRYVADDLWHRLLVFIQIGGVATMGLSVSGAFGDLYVQFTLGYVLVRVMTILMYVRTYFLHPESRAYTTPYMVGFAGGIAIWLAALVLPAEFHWVAWLVAIAFEANYSDKVVTDEYRLLLTVAVAIFLLALAMINYGLDDKLTPHSQIKRVLVYLGVAVGIAGMGLLLAGLTATQFTGIIAVIMVLVVALNIYQSVTFAEHQLEHGAS